ncbi:MAG TPA: PTS sugar transporter subunit IIA [Planctomycetota bacterium]|nr:PTS sugar transporter subunit IIA [Planctomycetota bacterium]
MKLSELIAPELVVLPMVATDKWAAIAELARAGLRAGRYDEAMAKVVEAALLLRERSVTTGMERGIAIPHAAVDGLDTLVAVLGLAPAGIPFQSLDGQPARILVALTIPRAQKLLHIKTLAEIARLLTRAEVRERLLRCERADEVVRALRELDQGSPR